MKHTRLFVGAAAAALTLACAGAASAQTYNRIVVFGDSLSDSGNLFLATGGTNPPSPPYFQGRFSNGPVFVELLGFTPLQLGATGAFTGNVNYAFGGARTDTATTPPGMRNQLALYLSRGGTFGRADLVTVLGGANDIFQGIPGAAVSPNPTGTIQTVAVTAAGNIGLIVGQISNAGAGTVLVSNLPNLAYTPQFLTSPAFPLADNASVTFNAALASQLRAVADGTTNNIILMDLARASDFIRLNPGALGFTNITQPCLNTTTGTVCAAPDTYLYWDNVHPTAAGHRFLAALATDYAYYGDFATPYARVSEFALDHRLQSLERASDRVEAGGLGAGQTAVSLLVDIESASFDADQTMPEGDTRSTSVRLSADHGMSDRMRVGGMLSLSAGDAEVGPLDFSVRTLGGDVYAGWRGEGLFVNAGAGFGLDEYDDFRRITPVAGFVHRANRADGWSVGGRVQTGAWLNAGALSLSPRITLNALRTTTSAYQEDGPGARHSIAERTVSGVSGEISLRAETALSQGVRAHAELGYRDWLASSFEDLRVSLVDNTANELAVDRDSAGGAALVDVGVSAPVMGRFELGASYRGRIGDEQESHAGLLSLTMRY